MAPSKAAVKETCLAFKSGHGAGPTEVAYVAEGDSLRIMTCGADGRVDLRDKSSLASVQSYKSNDGSVNALAVDYATPIVAIGDDTYVKMLKYPSLELSSNVGRSTLPIRALAFSPNGELLAAAGDAEAIRLHKTKDGTVTRQLRAEGYVRSLAWDPEGVYLAATQADGFLCIYDASTGKSESRKNVVPKTDLTSSVRNGISWHPDGGTILAVPGKDNDVVLYERLSWTTTGWLSGGHTAAVNTVLFCPNGLYAASGGRDGRVCVWDMTTSTCIAQAVCSSAGGADGAKPAAISSMAWSSSENELAVVDEMGQVALWEGPVPEDMQSPAVPLDQLEGLPLSPGKVASPGSTCQTGADAGDGTDDLDDFIDHNDNRLGAGPRETSAAGGAKPPLAARGPQGGLSLSKSAVESVATSAAAKALAGVVGPPPQPPFQPCSTPRGSDGAAEGTVKSHFLALTQLGSIVSRVTDEHRTVDVSFHDTRSRHARVPLLTDFFGFTIAGLSEKGALYASPSNKDTPSMVMYRPFDTWAANSEWKVGLPLGEEAACVAVGQTFAAVATRGSAQQLRLFGLSGMQSAVITLAGAPVALCAGGGGHLLGVVTHAGPTNVQTKSQNLHCAVYDVSSCSCIFQGPCPISPDSSALTWLAFTDEGLLATADSKGLIRIRVHEFGGSWLTVFDPASEAKSSETFWPVSIGMSQVLCVVCKPEQPHPQVNPRPFFTSLPLKVPLLQMDGGLPEMESELILQTAVAGHVRYRVDSAPDTLEAASAQDELERCHADLDRTLLKVCQHALKADRHGRAMEAVAAMQNTRTLEGAMRLANHHKAPTLAERIAIFLQSRSALDAQNAAAAATYTDPTPAPEPYAPMHAQANQASDCVEVVAEEEAMEVQEQQEPTPLAESGTRINTAQPGRGGSTTFGSGGTAGLTKAASAGAPFNRATTQPALASGGEKRKVAAGSQNINNPFARRPTKVAKGGK